jgi:hypothetical protein
MGKKRIANRTLVGEFKGKRQIDSQRGTWEDNINMDLIKIVFEGAD